MRVGLARRCRVEVAGGAVAVARGELVKDGGCVLFIANKLGVAQPTATAHPQALARAGLVTARRIGQWTYYQRNEAGLTALKRKIAEER